MEGTVEDKKLDIMQTHFRWRIWSNGYHWNHEIKTTWRDPPYLVENKGQGIYKTSNILEAEPSLFLEFSELQPTMKCILDFANHHGLLIDFEERVTVPKESDVKFNARKETQDDKTIAYLTIAEPLALWQEEIQKMKWFTQVWKWLQNQQIEYLQKIIHVSNTDVSFIITDQEVLEQYSKAQEVIRASERQAFDFDGGSILRRKESPRLFKMIEDGDLLLSARLILMRQINKELERGVVSPRLLLDKDNQLTPYLVPLGLLSALWLQFYLTASGEKRFLRCRVCGKWEDATGRSKNWSVHQECATRERMKRYRQRLSEQSGVEKKPAAKKKATAKKPATKKAAAKKTTRTTKGRS